MPLPFLKPRQVAGLIIAQRKPDGSKEEQHTEGNEGDGLESCMEDLIRALNANDAKSAALAFRSACEVCDSSYAEDDNSFDAQNAKAAKQE
jgi:hypothetical protein